MVWRWIIRGVFLLALAIVVGVWVGSYWRHAVGAGTPRGHAFEAAIAGDAAFKIERACRKRTRPHGLNSTRRRFTGSRGFFAPLRMAHAIDGGE